VRLNRSFDGLSAIVREVMRRNPLSGHVFVFFNRRRTMVKLLVWTRGGFTIVQKRLGVERSPGCSRRTIPGRTPRSTFTSCR